MAHTIHLPSSVGLEEIRRVLTLIQQPKPVLEQIPSTATEVHRSSSGSSAASVGTLSGGGGGVGAKGGKGDKGDKGAQGDVGAPGAPGTVVTMIKLCPNSTDHYPTVFVEYALCIDSKLYAVYSIPNAFMTLLTPGNYNSTGIGSACNFKVTAGCVVTPL